MQAHAKNAHPRKTGPGRRPASPSAEPRKRDKEQPRGSSGDKLARKAAAKLVAVSHPALGQSPGGKGAHNRTNPERAAKRRRVVAFGGRRQYLKTMKALARVRNELPEAA